MVVAVLWLISYVLGIILISCFGCFLCFMVYIHHLHKTTEHIPSPPRSSFIFGHLSDIWKYKAATGKTTAEFLLEKRFECGPIFIIYFCHRGVVFLGDSSYLRHVFINNQKSLCKNGFIWHKLGFIYGERGAGYGIVVNTDKESWRKRRHIMNPAFHRKCLRDFMGNFNNVCDRFLARMDTVVDSGQATSMALEFGKVTLEAISQVSFNINTHAIERPDSPFSNAVRHYFKGIQDNIEIPLNTTFLSVFQFKLLQNAIKKEQIKAAQFLRKFAHDCIINRMKDIADDKTVPDDLLTLLIKDGSLSVDDISDEFVTIFLAGQETTANSLSFALYQIIRNPHVEAKILNEVNEVLGKRDYVEFDDLAKLKYLGQVMNEGLRMYPVVIGPSTSVVKGITVGGFYIPKGIGINGNQLLFGMNPEIWKNPEVFDPDRFADVENIPDFHMTHFPFSIGPRNCIGQVFAKFESKVILARLLRKFQFRLLPGQTDRKEARLTLIPKDGVMCDVARRK